VSWNIVEMESSDEFTAENGSLFGAAAYDISRNFPAATT
jgi:hypothetical protein